MPSSPTAPPSTANPVNVVTQTQVQPEHHDDFARWQQHLNDVISSFPGHVNHEVIPPAPPAQVDWVIIQRFASVDAARSWLDSDARKQLVAQALPWLVGPDDIHLIAADGAGPPPSSVSAIISTRIKQGQEEALRAWAQRIAAAEARFPGYQGSKLNPPIPGVQDDWVTIVRFDSEQYLDAWMNSPERKKLLDEAAPFTAETHYRTVRSGFEQWFQTGPAAAAPVWKQNMLTLLALYPVVFLFGYFVQTPLLERGLGWPFWLALFAGNAAGVLILTWVVPWVGHRFAWWLKPAGGEPRNLTLVGAGIVVALYTLFLLIFSQFP